MLTGPELETLVRRALGGEAECFSRLVSSHWRIAYCRALAILKDPEDAKDTVQDAMFKAFSNLESCREPERFSGWLMRIVHHQALNRVKRAGHEKRARAALEPGRDRRVEPEVALRENMLHAARGLNELQAEVFFLHDLEGLRHAEIAAHLEISEVMSRQVLFGAHQILRKRLDGWTREGSDAGT